MACEARDNNIMEMHNLNSNDQQGQGDQPSSNDQQGQGDQPSSNDQQGQDDQSSSNDQQGQGDQPSPSDQQEPDKLERCFSTFYYHWTFFWSVICDLVVISILVVFVVFYFEDSSFKHQNEYPGNSKSVNNCSVQINDNSVMVFEESVLVRERKTIFAKLNPNQFFQTDTTPYFHKPSTWIWTDLNSHILEWPESYVLWSFGILDLDIERNVRLDLDLSPPGCSFVWGTPATTEKIAYALFKMTESLTGQNRRLKHSRWCHGVILRDPKMMRYERYLSFSVQDIGYRCCRFYSLGSMGVKCDEDVTTVKMWTAIPFAFAFVSLLFCPVFLISVYQYVFPKPIYWIHQRNTHDEFRGNNSSSEDKWIYTDFQSPITFLPLITSLFEKLKGVRSRGGWGCLKKTCFALISLILSVSVVLTYIILFLLFPESLKTLIEAIRGNIPVGFLSLLSGDGFHDKNFYPETYGSIAFMTGYGVVGLVYLMGYQCVRQDKNICDCLEGKFGFNLDLIQKHGRILFSSQEECGIFEILHACNRAAVCPTYLCKWISGRKDKNENRSRCDRFLLLCMFVYKCLHMLPFGFACNLIHLLYGQGIYTKLTEKTEQTDQTKLNCRRIAAILSLSFVSTILHLLLVYGFIIIFFASAEFVILLFTFGCMSIIVYPKYAAGASIGVLTGLYLVGEKVHDFAKKYAYYRDLTISVSEGLNNKCSTAEAMIVNDGKRLLISGVNIRFIKFIDIIGKEEAETEKNKTKLVCSETADILEVTGNLSKIEKVTSVMINDFLTGNVDPNQIQGGDQPVNSFQIELSSSKLEISYSLDGIRAIHGRSEDDRCCFVNYKRGLPGIPESLWKEVVNEYIPTSVELVRTIALIVMICCVIWFNVTIILRYEQQADLNTIINSVIAVFLVRLSALRDQFSVDVDEAQKKDILRRQIRLTVLEYWTRRVHSNDTNIEIE